MKWYIVLYNLSEKQRDTIIDFQYNFQQNYNKLLCLSVHVSKKKSYLTNS